MQYPRPTKSFCVLITALAACGCASEPLGSICGGTILAGDLAISEILPNPEGGDGEGLGEYIEIYNASSTTIELNGFRLTLGRIDGTDENAHIIGDLSVLPGQFVVLANADETAMPAYADYSYGAALGSLRNSKGRVSISCETEVIDEALYDTSSDGKAIEQDGASPPDSTRNDDPQAWCNATQEISSFVGNNGSPGAPNDVCEVKTAGTCMDNGVSRAAAKPTHGDVLITEWMANPDGADDGLEWIEVRATASFDLNTLQVGGGTDALKDIVVGPECAVARPGDYLVIGTSETAAPEVDATANFTLANSDTRSVIVGAESIVIARADYTNTTQGRSWQIDPAGAACLTEEDARYEYAVGNFGTPGTMNDACPPVVSTGKCLDEGVVRHIQTPVAAQVTITEWLANPEGTDTHKEWFEVRFDASVDLNGLVLGDSSTSRTTLSAIDCIKVEAGTYAVFAKSNNPDDNGGLSDVLATFGFALNNTNETIHLSLDGTTLDQVAYGSSTNGTATQVDSLGRTCSAASSYGDGENRGTPGASNPLCP